jgi:hypothetical protein
VNNVVWQLFSIEYHIVMNINSNPDRRTLRQFGVLCAVVFGAWGGWFLSQGDRGLVTVCLISVAIIGGVLGWMRPQWLRPVFVGWMILVFPIGWLVSHLLLAVLFYGVFTPLGFLLRLSGKDPLRLRRPVVDSFWQDKPIVTDLRRYFRQY